MNSEQQPLERTGNAFDQYEKKTPEFRDFLREQILLPKDRWSDKFKAYAEEKYTESQASEDREITDKQEQELTFKRYLKGLDLDIEDLKNRKVLDIGCGKEGEFVKECIDRGITDNIYGLDLNIDPEKVSEYSEHFQEGSMWEDIPVKNMDYVLSVGALSLAGEREEIEKALIKAIKILGEGGELRIWPFQRVSQESGLDGTREARMNWVRVLESFSSKIGIKYEFRPTDIVVSGEDKDVWLEEVLVIKRKSV